ncbi:MAG: hypothetical protein M1838_000207 [Thelocarpon superellum]|nr:MAG: hypothetical protein M1838_000207 [Thelocarpon superellum]
MGRKKIEIKAIKDDRNRSVTFLKRKGGLFKKAHELSVLCSVDVAVIIFGHNKKLYEFSSGDINEIIGRYQYYGNAHEHKGPSDFNGGKDGDDEDDDEMASPPPGSHSSQDHPMMPHQLHEQPGYQHMRHHTPSASPPVPNGVPFHHHRHSTPSAATISRPTSRTTMRRPSSHLVPQNAHASQPPPAHNGYAYMPNPSIYNPQASAGMPIPPETSQAGSYAYPSQPAPHPQAQQAQQAYLQDQRRVSRPPSFAPDRPQAPAEPSPPQPCRPSEQAASDSLLEPKRMPAKSQSIFTPVEESRSLLARHWGRGTSSGEPEAPSEPAIKEEPTQASHRADMRAAPRPAPVAANPGSNLSQRPSGPPTDHQRAQSTSSNPDFATPSRAESVQSASAPGGKRPRLKVQIPDEASDAGSATGESSPKDAEATGGAPSTKGGTEGSHSSGVVLPPPSPSASALLSAGATGPTNPFNPFPRPNPPGGNSNETPISALPSRFMADGLLPSPSAFYPEWGFSRSSGESNMLPSPLNFQTPVAANGPSFSRDDGETMKRKSPEGEGSENAGSKRMKT